MTLFNEWAIDDLVDYYSIYFLLFLLPTLPPCISLNLMFNQEHLLYVCKSGLKLLTVLSSCFLVLCAILLKHLELHTVYKNGCTNKA